MKAFLWTCVVVGTVEFLGALYFLVTGEIPERTRQSVAINCAVIVAFAVWALVLVLS